MKLMVFTNFKLVDGPFGGANSFLRTLTEHLSRQGVEFVDAPQESDLIFLNALTKGHVAGSDVLDAKEVRQLASFRKPIVHRKVNYRASGSPQMRGADEQGVIYGDKLQLLFDEYVTHHIFQSRYSYDVFSKSGYAGKNHSIIHNGINTSIFNTEIKGWFSTKQKPVWTAKQPLKIVISSWSKDYFKGFQYYESLDKALPDIPNTEVSFVGRHPDDIKFKNIKVYKPKTRKKLANFLKNHHVFLQFASHETCSNALIEGLSCGLPTIYLDSGSNKELAYEYGVYFSGDWKHDVEIMKQNYDRYFQALLLRPYAIEKKAQQYFEVFKNALNKGSN